MKKILVVEDSKSVGTLLCRKLQDADFETVWAKSMAEAASLLKGRSVDFFCSILDLKLPDAADGEIIDLVMAKSIPAIVFTGNLNKGVREMVWSKNVVDYVLKDNPNASDYLVRMVKRLARNRQTKVLVVEDSGFFRAVISNLLNVHQFQVYSVRLRQRSVEDHQRTSRYQAGGHRLRHAGDERLAADPGDPQDPFPR